MKLQKQTITGFAIGAAIAVGTVLLFAPAKKPFYSGLRLNGDILRTIYQGDFTKMQFNFQYNGSTGKNNLEPQVYTATGRVYVDQRLSTVLTTGKAIGGTRTLVPYILEHNRVSSLLQMKVLDSIVGRNQGCYFELNPADYVEIDPADRTHIYYQIVPYTSAGRPIEVGRVNPRALQLNPSPPGRLY